MTSEEAQAVVGLAIRHARNARGLRQKDVAEMVGVDRTVISKLENGHASPTLDMLLKVARVLHVPVSDFVSRIR
jgi:putative transcriptional regulator